MTTKELDFKLARDIGRIRIAAGLKGTTLAAETVKAMDELDAGKERPLSEEIKSILESPEKTTEMAPIMTAGYMKLVQTKLGIHEKARLESRKGYSKFSAADRKKALQVTSTEVSKAATQIGIAFESGSKEAVINAAAAEVYAFDMDQMLSEITHFLGKEVTGSSAISFETEFMTFSGGAQEAIEHLEKVQYYGTWIYERFQPIGIIRITW